MFTTFHPEKMGLSLNGERILGRTLNGAHLSFIEHVCKEKVHNEIFLRIRKSKSKEGQLGKTLGGYMSSEK